MKFLFLSLLAFASLNVWAGPAAITTTCGEVETPVKWSYCVSETEGSTNQDILYVLHGGGGDGNNWNDGGDPHPITVYWQQNGYQAPRVVEISFGPFWLLVPQNASPNSGLFEVFVGIVMPKIESEILKGEVGQRRVLGYSMGGLNGAILAMAAPTLFRSVALTVPAFLGVSPFAGDKEFAAYAKERGVRVEDVKGLAEIGAAFIPDDETWQKFSPSITAATLLGPSSPRLYVSGSEQDNMFYLEGRKFAATAMNAGARVTWESVDGDHGDVNYEAIARFLMW